MTSILLARSAGRNVRRLKPGGFKSHGCTGLCREGQVAVRAHQQPSTGGAATLHRMSPLCLEASLARASIVDVSMPCSITCSPMSRSRKSAPSVTRWSTERESRSSRVTFNVSPLRNNWSTRSSFGRDAFAPLAAARRGGRRRSGTGTCGRSASVPRGPPDQAERLPLAPASPDLILLSRRRAVWYMTESAWVCSAVLNCLCVERVPPVVLVLEPGVRRSCRLLPGGLTAGAAATRAAGRERRVRPGSAEWNSWL